MSPSILIFTSFLSRPTHAISNVRPFSSSNTSIGCVTLVRDGLSKIASLSKKFFTRTSRGEANLGSKRFTCVILFCFVSPKVTVYKKYNLLGWCPKVLPINIRNFSLLRTFQYRNL